MKLAFPHWGICIYLNLYSSVAWDRTKLSDAPEATETVCKAEKPFRWWCCASPVILGHHILASTKAMMSLTIPWMFGTCTLDFICTQALNIASYDPPCNIAVLLTNIRDRGLWLQRKLYFDVVLKSAAKNILKTINKQKMIHAW